MGRVLSEDIAVIKEQIVQIKEALEEIKGLKHGERLATLETRVGLFALFAAAFSIVMGAIASYIGVVVK